MVLNNKGEIKMREELVEKLQEKLNVTDLKDAKPEKLESALENQLDEIKDNYDSMFDSMQILRVDMYDTQDELLKLRIANPQLCPPTNRPPITEADFVIGDDKITDLAKSTNNGINIVDKLKNDNSAISNMAKSVGFTSDMLK
jgi:hypothetical protein